MYFDWDDLVLIAILTAILMFNDYMNKKRIFPFCKKGYIKEEEAMKADVLVDFYT